MTRKPLPYRSLLVAALAVGVAGAATAPGAASAPSTSTSECAAVLPRATKAATIERTQPRHFAKAAARIDRTVAQLHAMTEADGTLWLDQCANPYFVDPQDADADAAAAANAAAPAMAVEPLADTFTLESNPDADKTIYLDFLGGDYTNSAWGNQGVVKPFSMDSDATTNFSDTELTNIQAIWQSVAEDYAAFDVNVTTRDLGADALNRSSSADSVYGVPVVITDRNNWQDANHAGGVAYVGSFANVEDHVRRPAWVFTTGVYPWKGVAEAAAHEAGHTLGLSHDGTSSTGYYGGSNPWAPIMGVGYYQPITQWSTGEYADANNKQDDISIIASYTGLRADDFGDTAALATSLGDGATTRGRIGTRADVDAFKFLAGRTTKLTVSSPSYSPNLDVKVTILDSAGKVVATLDPASAYTSRSAASGLDATWDLTLGSIVDSYTALVDGVGHGDPAVAGGYSDYASLGEYQISLETDGLRFTTAKKLPAGSVGKAYSTTLAAADGNGSYTWWVASGTVPPGLKVAAATATTAVLSGTPTKTGTYTFKLRVKDADGALAYRNFTVVVS